MKGKKETVSQTKAHRSLKGEEKEKYKGLFLGCFFFFFGCYFPAD